MALLPAHKEEEECPVYYPASAPPAVSIGPITNVCESHLLVDGVWDVPAAVQEINARLARGEQP